MASDLYRQFKGLPLTDETHHRTKAPIPPKGFVAVDELAALAEKGDDKAIAELSRLARGNIEGVQNATDARLIKEYAEWEKSFRGIK